jgi:ribose transport system substrate-binding protein
MRKCYLLAVSAVLVTATTGAYAAGGEIAVIVKTVNSNYWQNVQKGAKTAVGEARGYTMTFQGPAAESAIADEVNMVENAVNRKVAGIVLAPSDPDALVPAIKKAWEAHIPVVLIDSSLSDAGKQYYQSFLSTDNEKAGEMCAKALIDRVGQNGKIAIMSYVPGAGSEIGRVGGFRKYIEAHSKLQIVGPYYSQSQMATALNQTLQDFVRGGTIQAIAVQGSYQMGYKGIQTVVNVIEHKPVPRQVDTGVVLVDKQNLDSQDAKNVLY